MSKKYSTLIGGALLVSSFGAGCADNRITNPFIRISSGTLEVMMLDSNLEYIDVKVDDAFIRKNYSLYYKVSAPSIVDRFNSEISNKFESVSLPDWYRFVPIALLESTNSGQFLYDGCYISPLLSNRYHKASEKLRDMLGRLSFSDPQECERP